MINTIIFDNGGVIVDDAWLKFDRDIEREYKHRPGNIANRIEVFGKEVEKGRASHDELMALIKKLTNNTQNLDDLYHPKEAKKEVIAYIQELNSDYMLALLTNEFSDFDRSNKIWRLEKYFGNNIFQSSKMGFSKPDEEAYKYVLLKLEKSPNEVVYIDDKVNNIKGARKVGMNVIQYVSLNQLKIDLPKLIEDCNGKE
jgi:HAD superfamily hydrolase (TIGR01509 family)